MEKNTGFLVDMDQVLQESQDEVLAPSSKVKHPPILRTAI